VGGALVANSSRHSQSFAAKVERRPAPPAPPGMGRHLMPEASLMRAAKGLHHLRGEDVDGVVALMAVDQFDVVVAQGR